MDTLKIIISKANSIRFAHVNGLMKSFDNTLSSEEVWSDKPKASFEHIFFKDDVVLVQVKAGLTATVVLTKKDSTSSSVVSSSAITTYSEFKIYEYVLTLSSLETFYLEAESEESLWRSECVEVINEDSIYVLLQWSNLDPLNDSFEFDYQTALAIANVNLMRIKGQLLNYKPAGQGNVYDNQNEKVKLKGILYRILTFQSEIVPRQIAEIIVIAMQHDLFLINQVGYISDELPEIEMFGSMAQIEAELTLQDSLGLNTDDIGFTP